MALTKVNQVDCRAKMTIFQNQDNTVKGQVDEFIVASPPLCPHFSVKSHV